jgi:RNA polymerase sigma factor (sigma-70 family)
VAQEWDWAALRARCRREAVRILRAEHDADEVVQEALARAWRHRARCRTPEAPLGWCLRITRNEAFRLMTRRRDHPTDSWPDEESHQPGDERAIRETEVAAIRVDVRRVVSDLSARERMLVGLRYEYDWSHPEIAAALGIPEATARVHLHRLHQRLRPLLDDER